MIKSFFVGFHVLWFCLAFTFPACAEEVISVDESDAVFDGSWQTISEKAGYASGPTFRYAMLKQGSKPSATATFRPHIPAEGTYHVEVYSSPGRNRWSIPCVISGSNGRTNVVVDQTKSPAGWRRAAENIAFSAGNTGFVQLDNNRDKLESIDKIVVADAVRFIRVANEPAGVGDIMEAAEAVFEGIWLRYTNTGGWARTNYTFAATSKKDTTATYRPNIPKNGRYDIYIWYKEGKNRAFNASWEISSKEGSATVVVDQRKNAGDWFLIGTGIEFIAGTTGFVRLSNPTKNEGAVVIADSVAFVYIGPP